MTLLVRRFASTISMGVLLVGTKLMRMYKICYYKKIPVHCWNCLVASPADSELYKQYQECLVKNSAYHNVGLGLLMLIVMAVLFA